MKSLAFSLVLCALAAACAAPTGPRRFASVQGGDEPRTVFEGLVGARSLDEDDFEPVDDQFVLGATIAHEPAGWPIGIEFSVQRSDDSDTIDLPPFGSVGTDAELLELALGLRGSTPLGDSPFSVFAGAGVSLIEGDVTASFAGLQGSEDDSTTGFYFHTGAVWNSGENVHLGVDLRALLGAELDLAGIDVDADYTQIAFIFGFSV